VTGISDPVAARLENPRLRQIADTDAWPLQVAENRDRPPTPRSELAN